MIKRAAGSVTLTLGAFLAATAPATAQVYAQAPMQLFPGAAAPGTEVIAPQPAPIETAPSGITIGGLADVDPEAVGILSNAPAEPWNRDLGPQVWFSLNHVTALARLRALPLASVSPTARGIGRQLVLSAAAPLGAPGVPKTPGMLSATRLEILLGAGDAEDAKRLAAVLPPRLGAEPVSLAAANAEWLLGDAASACKRAEDGLQAYDQPIWAKQNAVCAAIAGDSGRAQLGVSLLAEVGGVDPSFQPLAEKINGHAVKPLAEIPAGAGLFEVAAMRRLGIGLPDAPPLAERPWLARLVAPAEGAVNDAQLASVEFGLRHGAVPAAEAARAYERVKFSADDLTNAQALKAPAAGPRGRALYWQALKAAPTPEAQVMLLDRMLAAARADREAWAISAPLLAKPLADLKDVAAAVGISGEATRVALWTGDWTLARAWAARIAHDALTSDEAKHVAADLKPLFQIVDAPAAAQSRAQLPPPAIAEWYAAEAARGVPAAELARVRDRLFGLYRVLSLQIAEADWQAALAQPGLADGVAAPPLLLAAADEAAQRGAKGLSLSLVAQALDSGRDAAPLAASSVEGAVAALLKSASVDWAKRAAVESLIAAGY